MSSYKEISFLDSDVVNRDDFIPAGEYNPHNVRPFLLHDHGFTLAIVFASNLQEALDIAIDENKLDSFLIDLSDKSTRDDYLTSDFADAASGLDENCAEWTATDGTKYWWKEGQMPAFLGNASEPFDIEGLDVIELPNPKWSFAAMFDASAAAK